MNILIVFLPS